MVTLKQRLSTRGFTMIELMVVLAVVALLLTLVAPRYFHQEELAKEQALQYNLQMLRKTLDDYKADKGKYPRSLQELVTTRYIRVIPPDPLTGSADSWLLIPEEHGKQGIYDIKSAARGVASDGSRYADW
ncbi:prepilin-type N-terminal cleavage/methylation domain-containing protein [Halopseudomonas sabulinigri]|uniref:Type II secretion system protein G n=1 Tax=Halopseudomonas sabulinigri TaxID=472181 RepID=A0ABP9ZUR8_9GAMM